MAISAKTARTRLDRAHKIGVLSLVGGYVLQSVRRLDGVAVRIERGGS